MLKRTHINYDWKYHSNFKKEYILDNFQDDFFEIVNIPHTNIEIPYNNFDEKSYQFESCYRKEILVDDLSAQERVYIRFEGIMTHARVYLNGHYIGEHKGGYTPFRLDLTDEVIPNNVNTLVVHVDSREKKEIPPFGKQVDYLTYGGIYREVSLEYCNNLHVENLAIKTRDLLTPEPKIEIDLYINNEDMEEGEILSKFQILDMEGNMVYEFLNPLKLRANKKDKLTVQAGLEEINLWDIDKPYLYSLRLSLIKDDATLDRYNASFGFRDINFTNKGFYLNGRKVKLRGLNRHQSFPYVGYAMPKSAQYKDADILKYELGVNMVRTSHYPQSKHFLDRCDEIGLLVFEEVAGWRHVGDKVWQDLVFDNVRRMILNDINHPSIVLWGIRITESDDFDILYQRLNSLAKEIDDSRPTGGVRSIGDSQLFEDIYTYNDYVHNGENQGLNRKKRITKTDRPYLVTEHTGHMYPTKKFDSEGRRREHALRHLRVLEAMEADDEILGAIGWSMFDYNTQKDFGSGDNISYGGVMDMFRIPKDAAYVYASQQNMFPLMHVASSLNPGDYNESLLEDIYVFTNCDYVKLYRNNRYIGRFYPNKKEYPNLQYPPVIVDDLIGDALEKDEKFSKSDAKILKELLFKYSKVGSNLGTMDNLKMGRLLLKYKMDMLDAEKLYIKYLGTRGGPANTFKFEGYVGDKCIFRTIKGQVKNPRLKLVVDERELVEDITYDTTRTVVKLVDDHDNDIIYSNEVVTIETEGPIEIIGPSILSLIGGSIGFWIKTNGGVGEGKIILSSQRFATIEETIEVR